MYKIIGLVGPSGCGKDCGARYLSNKHPNKYHYVKLSTTRPQRDKEDDGYIFMNAEQFLKQILNGDMLSAQEFNGWYYGLSKDTLVEDKINIIPMNSEMVAQMTEENRKDYDLKIIYITTYDKERLIHVLKREEKPDCKEVCRRFLADITDYEKNNLLWNSCYAMIENHYDANFLLNLEMLLSDDKDKMD